MFWYVVNGIRSIQPTQAARLAPPKVTVYVLAIHLFAVQRCFRFRDNSSFPLLPTLALHLSDSSCPFAFLRSSTAYALVLAYP